MPDLKRVMSLRPFGSDEDGYPSGQRGLTVNQLAGAFGGSNPSPSTARLFSLVYGCPYSSAGRARSW